MSNRRKFLLPLAIVAVLLIAMFPTGPYAASLISWMAIGALMASSMRFVLLFGELNFAVAAFVGIGAYTAGMATTEYQIVFPLAILLAGLAAAFVSFFFGFITLKVKGPYFKLIGFAFAEVVRICYSQSDTLGGNSGIIGVFPPLALDPWMTFFVVSFAVVILLGLYAVERSDFGKLLLAIKENDDVVRTVGINVHWIKILCFVLASFVAGLAGSLQAFVNNVISPADFGFMLSVFALAYLKVGGEDSPLGPVAGSIVLVGLGSIALTFGAGEHIFYGAAIALAVLFFPKGMIGFAKDTVGKWRDRGATNTTAVAATQKGEA
ncbi:branched-chain amino acid ABC transporter permease [Hoeflea sp. G2-23]|uniref:Branched-chain amino acid ABC transporter permease n=1 Tax=Hoeflea algicola TaxID=2983763 RepID=A0ABT3ZBZ9_9HYPH|nr:branched-chain amino acid ABC transporter permease [Hoeflea algicola]MCY0149264.1 branched-chain amino acid ABC transporter permease [Hoeflea algicola]